MNVDHEENVTIIEKGKTINILMIKNAFSLKKCIWESLVLIYKITLEWLPSLFEDLKKVSQSGWFEASTIPFPTLLEKLRMVQMKD